MADIDDLAGQVQEVHAELASVVRDDSAQFLIQHYASLFARFQLERVYAQLFRDGHYDAARATREQIDGLVEFERHRGVV